MFIYFNQNKLAYHKGQLTPFFIAFIIILLIATLVTINVGKVGLIKTYSSNAADAGALAGGSVMATVFNAQSVMNSEMITAYETFYAAMAAEVGIVIAAMWIAGSSCAATCYPCYAGCCCGVSPGCNTSVGVAIKGIKAAMISLTAFQVKQYYYYEIMREQADEGREAALEAACRYAFLNSGISSKLKSCQLEDSSLCKDCEDNCDTDCRERCGSKGDYEDEEDYNDCMDACIEGELNCLVNDCQSQQAEFQLWLREDLEGVSSARYSWLDGQEREHEVSAAVNTQDVDSYKLKLTASPTAGLLALLYLALTEATTAQGSCNLCWCTATIVAAAAASIDGLLLATLAGLVPAWELDASAATMILFPICWISDINHDRLLDLTTWQEHEGEDYGSLGKTDYPHIESYSQVNFEDEGEIYYPNPYFDTSIIKTDAEK